MRFHFAGLIVVASLALGAASGSAAEVGDLVKQLASTKESERTAAIKAIRELKAGAEAPLRKLEDSGFDDQRQQMIVRRLIGACTVDSSPLKPIDPATVVPLGENTTKGIAGNPHVSLNKDSRVIVMTGEFCLENGPLEYLIVSKGIDNCAHESVVSLDGEPSDVCKALLVCNYAFVDEPDAEGKVKLPKDGGVMISIEFEQELPHANMKPSDGRPVAEEAVEKKTVRLPIESFVWNIQTEHAMKRMPFAFTGSRQDKDERGQPLFVADVERSVVALKVDSGALLNTPLDMRDIDPNQRGGYAIDRHVTPSRHTRCKVVFEPWQGGALDANALKDTGNTNLPGTAPARNEGP
jgi:hypothetical protein